MNKTKKKEKPSKPRNVVTITLNEEMRRLLEEDREQQGGNNAGITLAQVARQKVARQLECEKKGARC